MLEKKKKVFTPVALREKYMFNSASPSINYGGTYDSETIFKPKVL